MTQRKVTYIDGGSPQYWRLRTEGFRPIREANETAVSILVAQRRTSIGTYEIRAAVAVLMSPEDDWIEDPARNPLWGPDID
ncbi:hypothetical protein [Shinella sp.]|uniref:hypothetical protein n=1 Tax=Shinella sp. TaxID=1870904 RepID=UPI0039E2DA66